MQVSTEEELLSCFRAIDRGDVELSPDLRFPLTVEETLSWSFGPRAYLLFRERPDAPLRGIVFHRNSGALPDVVAMCEWCHAVRGHGRVKLLSAFASEHRRVGLYLCGDLSCVQRAHEAPGPDDLTQGLDGAERTRRTLRRIADFAARRLF